MMNFRSVLLALSLLAPGCLGVSEEEAEAQAPGRPAVDQGTKDLVPSESRVSFADSAAEVSAIQRTAQCRGASMTSAQFGHGALFGCIEGAAETAKLFVNEEPGSGSVQNVKVMWNDWFKDLGYGLHADREEANRLLTVVVTRYAPQRLQEVQAAYFGGKELELIEGLWVLTVTHQRGPAIEEHLLTIADAAKEEARSDNRAAAIQASSGLFERCKDELSTELDYPRSALLGDGEPTEGDGHKSFLLEGANNDLFFCEVYPGGSYKIKAAFERQFPFKYVASGTL